MSAKKSSPSDKAQHQLYKAQRRWEVNRIIKLKRALKRNPENKQIEQAINAVSYRRKTPTTQEWSKSTKAMASLIKKYCGYCDKNIFNSNKDVRYKAFTNMAAKRTSQPASTNHTKGMFSIMARAHNKGVPVWNT